MARAENLTIMFVDMANFSDRTARQSREQNKVMLRDFHGLLLPQIARFGGRRIKSIGDAFLATFRSPTDSVRCGMAMHDAVAAYNHAHPHSEPMRIRVALNAGEVRLERNDIFGEAVNIAARVEEMTPPGEIYLTGVVYLSMNKAEVPTEHIGEKTLKGVPEPVRVFRVPGHRLVRATPAEEALDAAPGEPPYGGMHVLPPDAAMLERVADSVRRAPYIDWNARLRAIPTRTLLRGIGVLGLAAALVAIAYGVLLVQVQPPPAAPAPAPGPSAASTAATAEAREALRQANALYFSRQRVEAATAYARVLEMDQNLRHDSGLASNLVGTLGYTATAMDTVRQYPSEEITFELARRTALPGRIGAQRAAQLLREMKQGDRINPLALALTELREGPDCADRLAAVKSLRALKDPRALPDLRALDSGGFRALFREDKNACLKEEARAAIAELEKQATPAS